MSATVATIRDVKASLSRPVRILLRHGLLDEDTSFFDYGCGNGHDLRTLRKLNISASGWDPKSHPDAPRLTSDIVNLGHVLNVISDAQERRNTLTSAWQLTRRVLVVTVPVVLPERAANLFGQRRSSRQGSDESGQGGFTHRTLKTYIDTTLGVDSLPAGLGVYLVFRDIVESERLCKILRISSRIGVMQDASQQKEDDGVSLELMGQSVPGRPWLRLAAAVGLAGSLNCFGQITPALGLTNAEIRNVAMAPCADISGRVKKIVVEHLGVEADKATDNASFIDDLGADSLDTVEIVMALEEEFRIQIPDDAAEKLINVGEAIRFLKKNCQAN